MKNWQGFMLGFLIAGIIFTPLTHTSNIPHSTCITVELSNSSPSNTFLSPYRVLPLYQDAGSAWFGVECAVLDLTHDHINEFVFIQLDPDYYIAMNASGGVHWIHTVPFSLYLLAPGDFDRDGYIDDVITYNYASFTTTNVLAWNETGAAIDYALNGTIHYDQDYNQFIQFGLNRIIGDFNSDGYYDDFIFIFSKGGEYFCSAMNYFSRTSLWNCSLGDYPMPTWKLPCDLNKNGYVDNLLVLTAKNVTYAIDNDGSLLWNVSAGGQRFAIYEAVTCADLDHDGFQDDTILISPCNNSILAFDNVGTLLWNFTSSTAQTISACDLNNDTWIDEICVVEHERVLTLNRTGHIIWEYSPGFSLRRLLIADVTLDGYLDFLVSGTKLLVLNTSGAALWAADYGGQNVPITLTDADGDAIANDPLCKTSVMTTFRWGPPNITVRFLDGDSRLIPTNSQETLGLNFTNYEPFLSHTITYSTGGFRHEITLAPHTSTSRNAYITLEQEGTTLYHVNLEFHGALFYTATITVTGVNYLKWVGIGVAVVGGILIGVAYVRYRRAKAADADEMEKKERGKRGVADESLSTFVLIFS